MNILPYYTEFLKKINLNFPKQKSWHTYAKIALLLCTKNRLTLPELYCNIII